MRLAALATAAILVTGLLHCSGSDANPPGSGGSAGSSGAGAAGTSSSGGSAGNAGSAGNSGNGGNSGNAGSGGSGGGAGNAGNGGSSGNAGSSGAGNAGSGGNSGSAGSGGAGNAGSGGNSGSAGSSGAGTGGSGGDAKEGGVPEAGNTGGGSPEAGVGTGGSANEGGPGGGGNLPALTVYLMGDSTVMDNGAGSAQEGWGMEFGPLFTNKVTVIDRAIGGRSVQSFMYSDASNTTETDTWKSIQSSIKPGDYLMVQFGANDSSGIAGRAVTPADYETLLGVVVDKIKAKQATPILVTPSALQQWVSGKETNTRLEPYAAAVRDLGPKKNVLVDDLNARSVEYLNMIGETAAAQVYIGGDKAHFTKYGATQMAQMVAKELRRIGSPLAGYLK